MLLPGISILKVDKRSTQVHKCLLLLYTKLIHLSHMCNNSCCQLDTSGIRKFLGKDSKVTLHSHLHLIAFFQWYPKSFMPLFFLLWIPPEAMESLCDNPVRRVKQIAVCVVIASAYINLIVILIFKQISTYGSNNACSQGKHTC